MAGVLILAGQTGAGKSELALELAERFDAEIVGADSRQIYRDMPVGTAAPASVDLLRVPHHLVSFLDPCERYSAARFAHDAMTAIDAIARRGKRAIVVGGTGFYIRALCGDVGLHAASDGALRDRLAHETRAHPREVLHEWLSALDAGAAARIEPNDVYRVTRALEIALVARGEKPGGAQPPPPSLRSHGIPFLKVLLTIDPETLAMNIERRVDAMLAAGFVAEAERIGSGIPAAGAVGYPQAIAYGRGWLSERELRAQLIRQTRRYAKRQATWFRREPELVPVAVGAARDALPALVARSLGWPFRSNGLSPVLEGEGPGLA